jgi:hypothetical protein
MRSAAGVLAADELPIAEYDALNVSEAVAAIKELTNPSDVRAILAYEEAHKNRHSVVPPPRPASRISHKRSSASAERPARSRRPSSTSPRSMQTAGVVPVSAIDLLASIRCRGS